MATPNAPTTAQIVANLGPNSQEQHWVRNLISGHLGKNPYTRLSAGILGGKPIMTHGNQQNLRGKTINLTSEAPLGGDGRQGSDQSRSGQGENIKRKVFSVSMGNHWNGVSQNNIAAAQTVMGYGDFDIKVRNLLKDWFAQRHAWTTEAEIFRCTLTNAARTRLYGGSKTSIADLTGADTADQNLFRRMSDTLTNNMAEPFAVAKRNGQEIERFLIIPPSFALEDLHASGAWQTLLANAGLRGEGNFLFTGEFPDWAGSAIVPWQIQNSTADGPQGSLSAPIAFLGETIAAGTASFTVKGGSNAAGAALDRSYFLFFPGAQFETFEQVKIAQETALTKYCLSRDITTGKFAFFSYTTTDGKTITGVKRLGSINAGTGATTLGGLTWSSLGVWANKMLDTGTEALTVGSPIWPCNAKGQCFVHINAMGQHALTQMWGSVDGTTAMGKRTINNDDDHQRFKEIGFEEQWGIGGVQDANGLYSGLLTATVAWNPDGAPTNIA